MTNKNLLYKKINYNSKIKNKIKSKRCARGKIKMMVGRGVEMVVWEDAELASPHN